jgi:hypothetical protein
MAHDDRSFWAKLDWWGKLELLGIAAMIGFCMLTVIDPILARSIAYAVADIIRGV